MLFDVGHLGDCISGVCNKFSFLLFYLMFMGSEREILAIVYYADHNLLSYVLVVQIIG